MNRFWLKISGVVVLIIVVIIGVCVFWPTETKPVGESKAPRRKIRKEVKRDLKARPGIPLYESRMSVGVVCSIERKISEELLDFRANSWGTF